MSVTPATWTGAGPVTVTAAGLSTTVTCRIVKASPAVTLDYAPDSVASGVVTFTPVGAPDGVYDVVLLDAAVAEVHRENASLTVAVPTPSFPPGITLTWVPRWGGIKFTAGGLAAGETVRLVGPGGQLIPIRGYETDSWQQPSGDGFGWCLEMPLGVTVGLVVADVSAATLPAAASVVSISTPPNKAWLRDLHDPALSVEVAVVGTGVEGRPARQTVHRIAGRARPIVRWDVRESRQGTVTFRIENDPDAVGWVETDRDRLDRLVETGRPLLLSTCHKLGFPPCYLAAQDVRYTRLGKTARWSVEMDYIEVDNPSDVDVLSPAATTFADALALHPTFVSMRTTTFLGITAGL